jgi:nucleoside-diphosphate-sugar epimerase
VASDTRPVIGVTGSSGYLGGALTALLRTQGHDVVEFRRTVPSNRGADAMRSFELGRPLDEGIFDGVTSLVHAAWDLRETDRARSWERNVEGSKRVLAAALEAGVTRVVFVSSMSAYFGTRQDYGLMKLAVERAVLEADQVVVRPGLVYGGAAGGMALTLSRLARLPVIPVFRGANSFTAHVDDVVAAMATLALADHVPSAVVGLAQERSVPFATLMRAIATAVGSSRRTVVVPWQPLLVSLRIAEKIGVPLPVRSDSLLGLVRPAPAVPGLDVAALLGLTFRPFPDGLEGSFPTN